VVDVVGFERLDVLVDGGPETGELGTKPVTYEPQPHAMPADNVIAADTESAY